MEAFEADSSANVIHLGVSEYKRLVATNPRPYDVVTLWNVKPGQLCDHCIVVGNEFNQMVYSFIKERGSDVRHKEKKIFFVVIEFGKDRAM